MQTLLEHARRELELCGQLEEDPEWCGVMTAAIAAVASFGHSGESMQCGIHQLTTLLSFGALSPLTDDPEEWFDQGELAGVPLWQNRRCSAAFSSDGGKTYYLVDDSVYVPHVGEPVSVRPSGQALYHTASAAERGAAR